MDVDEYTQLWWSFSDEENNITARISHNTDLSYVNISIMLLDLNYMVICHRILLTCSLNIYPEVDTNALSLPWLIQVSNSCVYVQTLYETSVKLFKQCTFNLTYRILAGF